MPTLLFEVGLEELPARFVVQAEEQLKNRLVAWMQENRISHGSVLSFSTPRRLAVQISDVAERQTDLSDEVRGPARKIAQTEDGAWSKAALGFARSQGVTESDLTIRSYKNEDYVFAMKKSKGEDTFALLPEGLRSVLLDMSFPKNMRWGDKSIRFARPIRWLVGLFDEEVIPLELAGVEAGRISQGHRFLGAQTTIMRPEQYEAELLKQSVIADREVRKQMIERQIKEMAEAKQWEVHLQSDLLEEVTDLVEFPQALYGSFEPEFLDIPEQVLITSMREHQRYFPVRDQRGQLLPHFITVRNGDDRSLATVAKGNEKVLRARLADARFFYQEDQKLPIQDALDKLESIVFHEELGTVAEKTKRIVQLADFFAGKLGMSDEEKSWVRRAAEICKFDLVTLMVNEFPELQGVMGEDYARKAGEPEAVAKAVVEHYQPAFSGDSSPHSRIGALVSLTDKMDTLAGCFAIGIHPTGSQDPYALRRQASGVVQMILDHSLPFTLGEVIQAALDELDKHRLVKKDKSEVGQVLYEFFSLRVKHVLADRARQDVTEAVMAAGYDDVKAAIRRAQALNEFVQLSENRPVLEAFKRVQNLAAKAQEEKLSITSPDPQWFEVEAENHLFEAWKNISLEYGNHMEEGRETEALENLARLREVIPQYFDQVMVMAENEKVKHNRLAMLSEISASIQRFADFHQLTWK